MIMGSQSVFILKTRHVISKFRHYPEFASKCCLQNDGGKPDQKPHLILFQAQVVAIMSRSDIAVFFEKYDEMAGAAESERRCHIRYRIGGISQQPFSMSQPPKICISADRHSVFGTKNPVEMSGGKIKFKNLLNFSINLFSLLCSVISFFVLSFFICPLFYTTF